MARPLQSTGFYYVNYIWFTVKLFWYSIVSLPALPCLACWTVYSAKDFRFEDSRSSFIIFCRSPGFRDVYKYWPYKCFFFWLKYTAVKYNKDTCTATIYSRITLHHPLGLLHRIPPLLVLCPKSHLLCDDCKWNSAFVGTVKACNYERWSVTKYFIAIWSYYTKSSVWLYRYISEKSTLFIEMHPLLWIRCVLCDGVRFLTEAGILPFRVMSWPDFKYCVPRGYKVR